MNWKRKSERNWGRLGMKCKLEEIVDVTMGQSPKSEYYNTEKNGYPFLQGNRTFGFKYPTFDTYTTVMTKFAKSGDVIMSVRAPVGALNITPVDMCLGRGVCSLRMKNGNQSFLFYMMKYYVSHLIKKESGTVFGSVNRNDINGLEIDIPEDVEEQKKIARYLEMIDDKIELNNAINNNLEQQMQALYKSWFIDFKPFGNTMPCNWKTGKLKEVLKLKRQSLKAEDNTELPYLPIDVIPMRTFALTGFKPNSEAQSSLITFDKDDIIIGAMRVYFHRVVLAPCDGITRTTCFTLVPHHKEYLSFALLCCDQDSSIDYAQSTSKGSTMPYAIWEGGLGDMEIAIPTLEIAQEFNKIVLPMLRQIQNSHFENNRLREMRDGLLPKLMSGELDVSNIDL